MHSLHKHLSEDVESPNRQNAPRVGNLPQQKIGHFDKDHVKYFGSDNATQVDRVLPKLLVVFRILFNHLRG